MLSDKISDGDVYKIYLEGKLEQDGYEKLLLYLTAGSMIKEHKHIQDSE